MAGKHARQRPVPASSSTNGDNRVPQGYASMREWQQPMGWQVASEATGSLPGCRVVSKGVWLIAANMMGALRTRAQASLGRFGLVLRKHD